MKHGLTRKATADEIHPSRSVTQSLAWIARQTRPDLSYRISKLQSTFECVKDLRECNRIVEYAIFASTCGIYFSLGFPWNDAVVATISDAVSVKNRSSSTESLRISSHKLALGNALNAEKMLIHPLSWSSTRIRRVCRSTLMAETYALSNAVEHGLRTRATVVDMRGQLNIRQWAAIEHVWCTDCESLFSHLISPNIKQVDNKRSALDLSALKQLICDNRDDCDEKVDGSKGDYPCWTDTSATLADCLTKTKNSCRLNQTLGTGIFDMKTHSGKSCYQSPNQTVESIEERAETTA